MLAYYGISHVQVYRGGPGQDFFDPRTNSVTLSPEAYDGRTVTATATACHEVGHACQFAQNYSPMKIRGALVPAVNLASNAWIFILLIGIFLTSQGLVTLAIVMYADQLLFQVVTLPVEFNASRRAMAYMDTIALPRAGALPDPRCSPRVRPHLRCRRAHLGALSRIPSWSESRLGDRLWLTRKLAAASEKLAGSSSDAVTVTEALMIAKGALNGVRLKIVGEVSYVSNKSSYSAVYFNVKDEGGTLDCMVWEGSLRRHRRRFERSVALVELTGYFDIYVKRGSMSFGVRDIKLTGGEGYLRMQVANLARKLEAEGLMDSARKRPLPAYPGVIGIVTSLVGAAVHDVLRTLRRRYPSCARSSRGRHRRG